MWTTKTQISLRIHAVWSAPLLLCCLHSVILIPAIFKISNLYLASVAMQAGLSTLVTNPEDRFSCDVAHFNSLYFSWQHFTVIYFRILFYPTFHSDLFLHIVLPNISQWFIFPYYSTQHFTVIYFPILFYPTFHSDLFSHIVLLNISQWFIFQCCSTQHFTVIYFPILFYSTFHSDLFSHIVLLNISQWFIFQYCSTQHFTVIYFPILFYLLKLMK